MIGRFIACAPSVCSEAMRTVLEVLNATVARYGTRPALKVKRDGAWQTQTWNEYGANIRTAARAMMKLGVGSGDGVVIIGKNCPEWLIADVGAIAAGGVPAGIYTTSTPDQCFYITNHCDARVAFAGDESQVAKFLEIKSRLPKLQAIVQMSGTPKAEGVLSWPAFLALASETPESALEERIRNQKPDDMCTLIYTSGTTGDPKAVMITHTNITWTAESLLSALKFGPDEVIVSYLPLSHIAEQMISVHGPINIGCHVAFADSIETVAETLKEVRPTVFLGVPRVWEKIQAKMLAVGAQGSPIVKMIAKWAKSVGLKAGYAQQRGEALPFMFPLAKKLAFDKVRERLGLDRARICVTSAAPISKDTLEYFLSLNIPILEVYGMSECTGPATYSRPDKYSTGKAGIVIPGAELKIAEDGEVCMRGPHVFKGYYKDAATTKETIDAEGWLHSGDIGTIDSDGFLQITDRKKDLLITAGGENIAPQLLEGMLKSIPVIGQAVVVGDRQRYLAALVTLDPERVVTEAELAGSPARDVIAASTCPTFRTHLEKQIEALNTKLARVQTIKKFAIVPNEFTIDGGELTPTMKVKRKVINEKYKSQISSLYA